MCSNLQNYLPNQFDSELIVCQFLLKENGLLFVPKGQAQNPQAQMFSDPNMAMDMMKKNLSMIIPQVLDTILSLDLDHIPCLLHFANYEFHTNLYCFLLLGRLLLLLG